MTLSGLTQWLMESVMEMPKQEHSFITKNV